MIANPTCPNRRPSWRFGVKKSHRVKGCNTSWISADMDSKLGKLLVCSTVCMHADSADRSVIAFAKLRKLDPREKKDFTVAMITLVSYNTRRLHDT